MCYSFLKINSTGDNNDLVSQQFASDFIATRPDWKLPEVKVFFDTIRQRQDLEVFNIVGYRITPLKLNEMLCAYEQFRSDEREKYIGENFKNNIRTEKIETPSSEAKKEFNKVYKMVEPLPKQPPVNHVLQPEEVEKFQESVSDLNLNSVNKKVQAWMKEFDALCQENEYENPGQRTVLVDGKKMNTTEYLEFMLNQNETN